MTYLDGPRFVVRELEGYATHRSPSHGQPGLCVTVVDRAYCCMVVGQWSTENKKLWGSISRGLRRVATRTAAERYAAELNAKYP